MNSFEQAVRGVPMDQALGTTLKTNIHDLIDERALALVLGVSCSTLQSWRYAKRGPRFLRIGRLIRYRRADVTEFLAASESVPGASQPT